MPNFANPTGGQWPADLADAVLGIVRKHGAFLIEDDWAHDFGITGVPTPLATREDKGHVVYIRSLTKSVSPSVRVAGLIARGPARERILADAQAQSMYVSGVLQTVALDVVGQPAWRTHLRSLRAQIASPRDLLIAALREPSAYLEAIPRGGLNLWLRLPDAIDLHRLVRDCKAAGVMVAAGVTMEFAWLTLTIHSSLEAVGLTAAFSRALADAGISCNVLAGYHHDHLLVPVSDKERAIQVLRELRRE